MRYHRPARDGYALCARERVRPLDLPGTNPYFDLEQVAYVLRNASDGSRLVYTSFGSMRWTVGQQVTLEEDQSCAFMGYYDVEAIVAHELVNTVPKPVLTGLVPLNGDGSSRALPLYVAK